MRGASAASCAIKTSARASHHESTGHIRRSARDGFFGLLRALPGNGRSLTPSSPRYLLAPGRAARKSSPDFGRTTRLGPARKAMRKGRISTRSHRAALSSVEGRALTRHRLLSAPSVRDARSRTGPAPWALSSARRCRVHRIPPRAS